MEVLSVGWQSTSWSAVSQLATAFFFVNYWSLLSVTYAYAQVTSVNIQRNADILYETADYQRTFSESVYLARLFPMVFCTIYIHSIS